MIRERLQVRQRPEEEEVWQNTALLNRDNVPLPPYRRTWGAWSFVGFWCATGINISGWSGGSALLSLGLSVGECMAVAVIANCFVALFVILGGFWGAEWHVGFPLWNRCTWGMRASYFPLLNRIVLSFTWCATQAWFGGQILKTLLGSLAPSIYTMHNPFPESTAMDGADFLCFCLFLLISFPLLHIPPEHYRKPFLFTAVVSTLACLSLLIWSLARAKGAGPLIGADAMLLVGVEKAKGAALGWAFVYGITSQIGTFSAAILNNSDYTRFAVHPRAQILSQAVILPVTGTLTCLVGILCTSCAAQFYPDEGLLWAPYDLLAAVQKYGGPGARAGVFFASFAFLVAQLGINIAGNAISGGIDLASIWPRYINIRRGAYITTLMALPMCPWALVSGATVYISVMAGYGVFLAPMSGIMVFDYFFIRHRKVKLTDLYNATPSSIYWYYKGVNWRAPIAWVCGVAPTFPGFIQSVSPSTQVPIGATHLYEMSFILGFVLSGTIYVVLAKIWPLNGIDEVDELDTFGTFGEPNLPLGEVTKLEEEDGKAVAKGPSSNTTHHVLEVDQS